jgi:hypothetical protein
MLAAVGAGTALAWYVCHSVRQPDPFPANSYRIENTSPPAVMYRGAWKLGLQHIDLLPLSKASMTTPIPLDVWCELYISYPYLIACGQIDF